MLCGDIVLVDKSFRRRVLGICDIYSTVVETVRFSAWTQNGCKQKQKNIYMIDFIDEVSEGVSRTGHPNRAYFLVWMCHDLH